MEGLRQLPTQYLKKKKEINVEDKIHMREEVHPDGGEYETWEAIGTITGSGGGAGAVKISQVNGIRE